MRRLILHVISSLFCCLIICIANAQSTYTSTNYATNGDTLYISKAQIGNFNFDTTGTGITWNYATLVGNSQKRLVFRLPNQTGFSFLQWPYIQNSNNVNLSSTNGETVEIGGYKSSDPNDYFLKSASIFQHRASSNKIAINGLILNVKNVFNNPDTLYRFPISFGNIGTSNSAYTTNLSPLYFKKQALSRKDTVKGWGTVVTPLGTFANCLKLVSSVTQIDSTSVNGTALPLPDTVIYREISWLDPSRKYPVLFVKQNKVGNIFITQTIEYLDTKRFYQPTALFAFYPVLPAIGDTVQFQNLSTNGYDYKWKFGDPASGIDDSSLLSNPEHIFNSGGNFLVKLIAYNGTLTDTLILPVVVGTALPTTFKYFKGSSYMQKNQLFWETYQEQNLDYFIIEKSTTNTNFKNIGELSSKGNNQNSGTYQFIDTKNPGDVYYYRIKAVSKDGKFQYSPVLLMDQPKNETTIQLLPNNISQNQAMLFCAKSKLKENMELRIYNASGSLLSTHKISLIVGTNYYNLPTTGFGNGSYWVQCLNTTTNLMQSLPFIVSK